jgi:hypothetical protein
MFCHPEKLGRRLVGLKSISSDNALWTLNRRTALMIHITTLEMEN